MRMHFTQPLYKPYEPEKETNTNLVFKHLSPSTVRIIVVSHYGKPNETVHYYTDVSAEDFLTTAKTLNLKEHPSYPAGTRVLYSPFSGDERVGKVEHVGLSPSGAPRYLIRSSSPPYEAEWLNKGDILSLLPSSSAKKDNSNARS